MGFGPRNPKIVLDNFGGVSSREHPFDVPFNWFTTLENIDRSIRALRTRLGHTPYIDKAYNNLSAGIKKMFWYRNSAGTKKLMVYDGTNVYVDSNNGQFGVGGITSFTPDADGYMHFTQYRDTVLMSSDTKDTKVYNATASPVTVTPSFLPVSFSELGGPLVATASTSGGHLLDQYYYWRVTFDVVVGSDFLGETSCSRFSPGFTTQSSFQNWSAGSGNDNKLDFKRPSDAVVDAIPAYYTRVNFYRSPPYSVNPWPDITPYLFLEDTELYYVGSVAMSVVRAATAGDSLFIDDGSVTLGKQISYGIYWYALRARYTTMFKGRLWAQNIALAENDSGGSYVAYPDAIIHSRSGANGEEPLVFQLASPKIVLDHYEGEGGTGIANWIGKALLAFKPTSSDLIIGGDDNISQTVANIQREVLSNSVGCIAPRTIIAAEDVVIWLAHNGPWMFNGRMTPLGSLEVKAFLDSVPEAMKRKAHALYSSEDRKYKLFVSQGSFPTTNRTCLEYSFITKLWTVERRKRGVGAAIEVHNSDTDVKVIYGYDDDASYFNTVDNDPIIVVADSGFNEGIVPVGGETNTIDWRMVTGYSQEEPLLDKPIISVTVQGKWGDPFTLDFKTEDSINDNGEIVFGVDTEAGIPTGGTVSFPVGGGYQSITRRIKNNVSIRGKLISLTIKGSNSVTRTEFAKIILRTSPDWERDEAGIR